MELVLGNRCLTPLALALALIAMTLAGGCGPRSPVAPAPPSSTFERAERALRAGDYLRADALYGEIVEGGLPERETALARRALIYALPETGVQNRALAAMYLDQLRAEYPLTLLGSEVEAVLRILPAIDELEETSRASLTRIDELESGLTDAGRERELLATVLSHAFPYDARFDPDRARADYLRLLEAYPGSASVRASERVLFLLSQWEDLITTGADQAVKLSELTDQIQSLQRELDRLKQIDRGRQLPN